MTEHVKPGRKSNAQQGAQSVHRTAALLKILAQYNETGARLSQIARKAGLHITTVRRILQVLVEENLVAYDGISKLYYLGWDLYLLGNSAQQYSIQHKFRPSLENIAKRTQDTVFLLIPSCNDALCVDVVQGSYPIKTMLIGIGSRRPMGIGTGSQALLSFIDQKEAEKIIEYNSSYYGAYNGMTVEDVKSISRETKERGYAVTDGLFHKDAVSIGVPIYDASNTIVAAITVSAIRSRMSEARREEIVEIIREEIADLLQW